MRLSSVLAEALGGASLALSISSINTTTLFASEAEARNLDPHR